MATQITNFERCAESIWTSVKIRPGVKFTRNMVDARRGKGEARNRIVRRVALWEGELRFLTMPSLNWVFEKKLLAIRCALAERLENTQLVGVENDPAIFLASIKNIPNRRHHDGLVVGTDRATSRGTTLVLGDIETVAPTLGDFDFAWLDFTGFITQSRLDLIHHLKKTTVLCVTSLAARWDASISKQMEKNGGLVELLEKTVGRKSVDTFCYAEPSPMCQVIFDKRKKKASA